MGWKNGVQYCQRNVETVLEPVHEFTAGYVDDILGGTDEVENETVPQLLMRHDREMRQMLGEMKTKQLVADIGKCKFFVKKACFCRKFSL